ncbi:hypothetical protein Adt_42214 [Abeliophyllum distichum]|uniref:Uncharacterized protein n=1 Tax=Abeliophyllum distichum TaxID=126358 RepID=A0ABD1PR16_9LAMI
MAEKICELEERTDANEIEKQSEFSEDSDFNPKRHRDENSEIVKKLELKIEYLTVSHSHPYSDPRDSRRYQPIDLLKEREHRPARSTSVFDRLGDEADFPSKEDIIP